MTKGKQPYRNDALQLMREASQALTAAVGAMILGYPGLLHSEAIRLSIAVDALLEAMEEEE